MKIVIDTNVLISGMLNPSGPPGKIVDLLRSGALQVVVDDRILSEYTDVLRRKYFLRYFRKSEREDVIEYLSKNSHYTLSRIVAQDIPDEGDIPFLEIALSEGVPLLPAISNIILSAQEWGVMSYRPGSLLISFLRQVIGPS